MAVTWCNPFTCCSIVSISYLIDSEGLGHYQRHDDYEQMVLDSFAVRRAVRQVLFEYGDLVLRR